MRLMRERGALEQLDATAAKLFLSITQSIQINVNALRSILRSQSQPCVCNDGYNLSVTHTDTRTCGAKVFTKDFCIATIRMFVL